MKLLREPLVERVGSVKTEHSAAPGIRLQEIGEASFYPCALVLERQRSSGCSEIVGYTFAVLGGLQLDTSKRVALFLGLNDSDRRSVNEKKIVSLSMP